MSDDPILRSIADQKAARHANRISTRLQHIAKKLEREFNDLALPGEPPAIFSLFVLTGGAAQYISNGERNDVKRIVASVLARWDDPAYKSLHQPLHTKSQEDIDKEMDDPL